MPLDYLSHLQAESTLLLDAVRDLDPSTPVPSCPEWAADDLLRHVIGVFGFWGAIVGQRVQDRASAESIEPATDQPPAPHAELVTRYTESAAALQAALAGAPADLPVWTWSEDHTAGFVRRRMAHEVLIHRLDAELTAGQVTPVDAALAADGVAEVLQHFYRGDVPWAAFRPGPAVARLRASDTGDEWLIRLGAVTGTSPHSGRSFTDEPAIVLDPGAAPGCTVTASARDLDAWLWNRPTLDEPEVLGSREDFAALAALVAGGI